MRAARAARLFFLIEPIKSFICGFVVAVPVVDREDVKFWFMRFWRQRQPAAV